MKNYKFTIRGNTYEVEIGKIENNIAHIEVNGTPYEVEIHQEIKQTKTPTLVRKVIKEKAEDIEKKDRGASFPIKAPLPGIIKEIYIKEGDIIKKEQKIMMMEAMKMENKILSDRDGVVEVINVKTGDSVLEGDKLIELI